MSFKDALKARKNRLPAMQARLEKEAKSTSYEDTRFWRLEAKDGVGSAIIRFLPPFYDQHDSLHSSRHLQLIQLHFQRFQR